MNNQNTMVFEKRFWDKYIRNIFRYTQTTITRLSSVGLIQILVGSPTLYATNNRTERTGRTDRERQDRPQISDKNLTDNCLWRQAFEIFAMFHYFLIWGEHSCIWFLFILYQDMQTDGWKFTPALLPKLLTYSMSCFHQSSLYGECLNYLSSSIAPSYIVQTLC